MAKYHLTPTPWGYMGEFSAMASPCELLIETDDKQIADAMMELACTETLRIEHKYSRFIKGNTLWQLNHSHPEAIELDQETTNLLQFAKHCFELSQGKFDITSGPLTTLWRFDKQGKLPKESELSQARQSVGFSRLTLNHSQLTMPEGMMLDLGGIGKEYAADRVAHLLAHHWRDIAVLVNFGGDIACPIAKRFGEPEWQVGIENPEALDSAAEIVSIRQGGLATSGDTRRFIEINNKRFGHIINPKSGYPIEGAPRSVTVMADNCTTAGMLATMAMLEGDDAENFLAEQQVGFRVFR
ncbi:FAD:protein FMN transferase [Shewanella woodyi]|uniref:FAD:protein FMN transferase n=1 Tax=Shewanella woodyi TaxID=60961 RepID=UPI0007F88821|nr:FAD:protein FMN transferase [Shewanella woodyi]